MNTSVQTSALLEGDVITNHGMRILIDGPMATYPAHGGGEVYVWPGKVLNADEVCQENGLIRYFLRGPDTEPDQVDRWSVQGNDLATWWVTEREVRVT